MSHKKRIIRRHRDKEKYIKHKNNAINVDTFSIEPNHPVKNALYLL